jgi:hypothetical protein
LSSSPEDTLTDSRETLAILARLESQGFAGWDPYDGLNARRLPRFVFASHRRQQIVAQLLKRSPDAVRRALDVPKAVSAYTLGHVLMAYARLHSAGLLADAAERAERVAGLLRDMSLPGWSGACWGYHFDVRTRFGGYDANTPNAIVTSFVAKGVAEATRSGLIDGLELLAGACAFITQDLARVQDDRGLCFLYTPHATDVIHNANALCAQVLALGANVAGLPTLDDAVSSARHTASYQRPDGAWPYAETASGRWVDSFHTGFVLESLHTVAEAVGDDALRSAVIKGMGFYGERLFDSDGAPRYYDTRPLPYDVLSAAEGIEVLTTLADLDDRAAATCDRLVAWTLANLVDESGRVSYRRGRLLTDRREFPRWSGAPLCSAMAARCASRAAGGQR